MVLYDLVIPIAEIDIQFFKRNYKTTLENIKNYNRIFIITQNAESNYIDDCIMVDEDKFPFKKSDIELYVGKQRAGWYFQQLLKLYSASVLDLSYFVILDSDVIIINPIEFFTENSNIIFNTGTEYHIPYFEHMKKVCPFIEKSSHYSGICHYMPMKSNIVNDFIDRVEKIHNTVFWKAMMNGVDSQQYNHSGMSEYEMLFNFTLKFYKNDCIINTLNWKNANTLTPDDKNTYTYVSIHWYCR
jgi:hypothetical protein